LTRKIYSNRFAAFIDILGFKQLIAQIEAQDEGAEHLHKRLVSVLNFLNEESIESNGQHDLLIYELEDDKLVERELGDPRITYISDCVIVSAESTFLGFKNLCNKLTKLATDLACDGMFLRGAITYGPLYHDKKFIFGSAYQNAYHIESTKAKNPRIVIDETVLNFLKVHTGEFPLNDFGTRVDADGLIYLHCFPYKYHPQYTFDWLGFLLRVKSHILFSLNLHDRRVSGFPPPLKELDRYYCWRGMLGTQVDFTGENESVLSKYVWLKDEFNRTLEQHEKTLANEAGAPRIAKIVDAETHWAPEATLGKCR